MAARAIGPAPSGQHMTMESWHGWALIFGLLAMLAVLLWVWALVHGRAVLQQRARDALATVVELRGEDLAEWREERLHDGQRAAQDPLLAASVRAFCAAPADPQAAAQIRALLTFAQHNDKYERELLLAPDGQLLMTTATRAETMHLVDRLALAAAVASTDSVLGNFIHLPDCRVVIDVYATVRNAAGEPLAVVVLRSNAETELLALLRRWPLPNSAARLLLAVREGELALILNHADSGPDVGLGYCVPLATSALPAAHALRGRRGFMMGKDENGVPVLACLYPIPHSPWCLSAEMASSDVVAPGRQFEWLSLLLLLAVLTLAGAATGYAYRKKQVALFQVAYVAAQQQQAQDAQLQQALQESKAQLQAVITGSQLATWDWNLKTEVVQHNDAWAAMLGVPPAAVQATVAYWQQQIHPDDQAAVWQALQDHLAGRTAWYRMEYRMRTATGQVCWVVDRGQVVARGPQGEPWRMSGTRANVTERRETAVASARIEARLRSLLQGMPTVAVMGCDAAARATYWNDTCERLYGYRREDVIGRDLVDLIVPAEKQSQVRAAFMETLAHGTLPATGECWRRHQNGTPVAVYASHTCIQVPDQPPEFYVIDVDLSALKRAESLVYLQSNALAAAANVILITDPQSCIQWVNPAFVTTTGYSLAEAEGQQVRTLLDAAAHDAAFYATIQQSLQAGQAWHGEWQQRCKDGRHLTLDTTITPVHSPSGELTHFIGVCVDVTARKLLEEQLQQAQKVESIGRLAGGVAHDVNNMLSVILGHAEMAQMCIANEGPLVAHVAEIIDAANRSADLVRQLLAFARKQKISPRALDLSEATAGMLKLLRRLTPENIQLHWVPAHDPMPVYMDPSQVDQLLANLTVNARDAVGETGTITLATSMAMVTAAEVAHQPGVAPGAYVCLTVADTGCGMSTTTMKRIFEPFFTTKLLGVGTGLGLATVDGIVAQNGGFIKVRSELGKGTTFALYLPRHDVAEPSEDEALSAPVPTGEETVLVVEDEPAVLRLTAAILEALQYQVLSASSPQDAIRLAGEFPGEIQLLVTDVIMPGMNGLELQRALHALRPQLKCLYLSGHTDDILAPSGVLEPSLQLLVKPWTRSALALKLRQVLQSP